MRGTIDELIEERAPWLRRGGPGVWLARRLLKRILSYERTVRIGEALEPMPGPDVMQSLAEMIALHVEISGLENIPETGPLMVVCNHPTGIADGIVLFGALARRRPDLFIFANADALRVLPQLGSLIAPVEWRPEKRTHKQNRETMAYAHRAFEAGRMGVLFPSGRLAKRRWLSLHERPWMASGAMLARRFDLPVVPLHITARNSALFYLFDRIHPTLRDITIFHEVLNKPYQPYRLTVGAPIDPATLPSGSAEATEVLRARTLELGGQKPQTVLTAPRYSRPRRLKPARLMV
ncbi:MAG TPA: 1-acyl-sn-glycerol-3-phosphate acyltransferase [Amaricoccus sp.]|uniref:1-acyl-sn-glycerol-3-phosphate acyltransferase n=1 Tax=Amaricoccus sp. TaxID=1872485 RepID=UPI002C6251BA|nr:1-acyl-sn-glycerol-3-phosphate acyltransferase [Amaricoccus sp.]HMQ91736.1 1-acyl-sn-glycerol-3-phosphate acyltransferase [Amaricoccus sp.]HMR52552.1 1-acyl-sn-glycerol-3-phosphate acyltransferase [Amaricoccus sp.]HMR59289.1 1-acyl-sn-glycerol-3-phosphate acyltransferase [Amaricoccus sp.]HMT99578.1 1-acyl-sn-glycerol-3-phosphate acyltransferase [Amaricoccus sp.]